jgi:hypothetical protein
VFGEGFPGQQNFGVFFFWQQQQEQEQRQFGFVTVLSLLIANDDILYTCTKFVSRLANYLVFY